VLVKVLVKKYYWYCGRQIQQSDGYH
jgi:hypothetical protein